MKFRISSSLLAVAVALAGCSDSTGSARSATPASLVVVAGDAQQGVAGQELPQPLVVRVLDSKGKPVRDQIVNFRVVSGGGSVFAGAAVTNQDGQAQERWTLGTVAADSQRVEARAVDSSTGQALVFGTFRAVATPGAAASVQLVGSPSVSAPYGASVDSLAARVVDSNNNPVANATVQWVVVNGGGSVSPATATSNAQGIVKTRWSLGLVADSVQHAEARLGTSVAAFAGTTTLSASLFDITAVGSGQTGTVGAAVAQPAGINVKLKDGRAAPGILAYWNGSGVYRTTDAMGNAYFPFTFPARTETVTYNVFLGNDRGGFAQADLQFTGTAATPAFASVPSNTFYLAGAGTAAGTPLTASLTLKDASSNPTPGVTVTWQVTAGNGTVANASTVTNASGVTTNTVTAGTSAYQEFKATIPGVGTRLFFIGTSPHTYTARILPTSPDTLVVSLNSQFFLEVEVRDENGQLYPNTRSIPFSFSPSPSALGWEGRRSYQDLFYAQAVGTSTVTVTRFPNQTCHAVNANCPPDDPVGMVPGTKVVKVVP